MATEAIHVFDPRKTVSVQGFSGKAATTTIHDATETGFQISGIFQAAEDFANIQLFSAYDYFNHLRVKPLPRTDLSGVVLQYDQTILEVNGEEGNVRPDCVKYASVGWNKLTITTGSGDIYEVPLMAHSTVLFGGFTPGSFQVSLEDKKAEDLDALLVGRPTPALTDMAYVYFMGTRWPCSSVDAIAFCNLETTLTASIGSEEVLSTNQAIWWQNNPNYYHWISAGAVSVGIREGDGTQPGDPTSAADIASRLASMLDISSWDVTASASGNVITVALEVGVAGPINVSSSDGSASATLSQWVPGIYTAQVASSAEIRADDYVGLDIGTVRDEVVKVISVDTGTFTAYFTQKHLISYGTITCRVLPRSRHFGRVLKDRMVDHPAPDYGDQPSSLSGVLTQTDTSFSLNISLSGPLSQWGREANGIPVHVSVDGANQIVSMENGVTMIRSSVQGSANDSVYRFTFDFSSLTGYKNGNSNSLEPVPATDIVKVHLTFAPRFEDVEYGLANGGLLVSSVPASAVGTQEEWQVYNGSLLTAGTKYYVGNATTEERITCLANFGLVQPDPGDPSTWYYRVMVRRGEDSSTPQAWPAGTRIQWISTITGTRSDVEWQVAISNIMLSGPTALKVGGPNENERLEETKNATYVGFWEEAPYATAWWSGGHAKRTAPGNPSDVRKVTVTYQKNVTHDLYVGTWLGTSAGKIQVVIDGGTPVTYDLYLNDYNGLAAMKKIGSGIAAGLHVVEITALFDKNPASTGYWFYYDYLWPLVEGDVPDAPWLLTNTSLAIDFDTDHGYKKPPVWHVWMLKKLGFMGWADVYMGVFWNNKRRRVEATYPNCTVSINTWQVDTPLWINLSGTTLYFSPGKGLATEDIAAHLRAMINVTFPGVWCTSSGGTISIRSRAPSYVFSISASAGMSISQGTPPLDTAGTEGDWELIDVISPVMTQGVRNWIRDLAAQFVAEGIMASWAFSMEIYNPPAAMRARWPSYSGGIITPGADVYLSGVPDYQMHFGARPTAYLSQMYKEAADQIAAGGMRPVLQFGETQWWYFPDATGMPFYDAETIADFASQFGHQIHLFVNNTDDPAGDPAYPYETANFLKQRIWNYCSKVISAVLAAHSNADFEALWPRDANQGPGPGVPGYRQLNQWVNLPDQWKTASSGLKYFRSEGYDYDVIQKNVTKAIITARYPNDQLGRPVSECMFLQGIFGGADPPLSAEFWAWQDSLGKGGASLALWALDQFCLNHRPVPIPRTFSGSEVQKTKHPKYAALGKGALVAPKPNPPAFSASGKFNRAKANTRGFNKV